MLKLPVLFTFLFCISGNVFAAESGKYFDRMITVIFENTNYADAIRQPFFKKLADNGANFTNFLALTHPSQGNYIALTSGSLNGVTGDGRFDVNANNIIDLLEAGGISWKVYAEGYPGNCYTGMNSGQYYRKHNPFISYLNVQHDSARCAKIVDASEFDQDMQGGNLPSYVFYVPDAKNDGHDTGVKYADRWYSGKFGSLIADPAFMSRTVLVSTFDESGASSVNQIYTSIVGPPVKAGGYADSVNLVSLLKLAEENWNLGNLGKGDVNAPSLANIFH